MATNKKGCRMLKVFKALEGHPIIGISNKEISDGLGIPPASVPEFGRPDCRGPSGQAG